MGLEENKQLILHHYEAFINQQDGEAARNYLAPDFIDHEMPPEMPRGPEGALQWREMIHHAFPDLHVTIEDIVAEGDLVAVHVSWAGSHRGTLPLLKLPPTNRSFVFRGMVFWRIREDRITERWATMDLATLRKQLTAAS